MRVHLQGFLLLGLLVAALWGASRLASPALGEAFGEDGAVVSDPANGDELVELTVAGAVLEAELTPDELRRLQFQLLISGFLGDVTEVDGIPGPTTDAAIERAAAEWDLADANPRTVLEHSDTLLADNPFFQRPS